MVAVDGFRQAEQNLEQTVDRSGVEQVLAPHDLADVLERIVDNDGQMVTGRRLLAGHNDIAPGFWPRRNDTTLTIGPLAQFVPAQAGGAAAGSRHIEPKRIRRTGVDEAVALVGGARAGGAGGKGGAGRVAGPTA